MVDIIHPLDDTRAGDWRVCRLTGRGLFVQKHDRMQVDSDQLVGLMDSSELALRVVRAVNLVRRLEAVPQLYGQIGSALDDLESDSPTYRRDGRLWILGRFARLFGELDLMRSALSALTHAFEPSGDPARPACGKILSVTGVTYLKSCGQPELHPVHRTVESVRADLTP